MPKTVAQLKKNEKCIYQAFANITEDRETMMGQFVNGKGLDADDTKAVIELAKKYALTYIDALNGQDYNSGFAGLDADRKIIAVVTPHMGTVQQIRPIQSNPNNLTLYLSESQAQQIFEKSPDSVTWHAIYGVSDNSGKITWIDVQGHYSNGPANNSVAVCFSKEI